MLGVEAHPPFANDTFKIPLTDLLKQYLAVALDVLRINDLRALAAMDLSSGIATG